LHTDPDLGGWPDADLARWVGAWHAGLTLLALAGALDLARRGVRPRRWAVMGTAALGLAAVVAAGWGFAGVWGERQAQAAAAVRDLQAAQQCCAAWPEDGPRVTAYHLT